MIFERIGRSSGSICFSRAHCHADWELCYNTEGIGEWILDDIVYTFAPGTIMICPPGTNHTKLSESGFKDCYLHFTGCDFEEKVYFLKDDFDNRLYHLMEILYAAYFENRSGAVCNALFEAIIELVRPMLNSTRQNEYVQILQQMIIREFSNPDFSLRRVIEEMPINRDHLCRLFKKSVGKTPHNYLFQLRMEYAKKLFSASKQKNITVAEAALQSGFYDPLYFSRMFRKYTGLSPGKWRIHFAP